MLALALLAGCATPAERFAATAGAMGLERQVVTGAGFRHVLFWKDRGRAGTVLHVYIDGDGTPDIGGAIRPPIPPRAIRSCSAFSISTLDRRCCSGAPCYDGLADDAGCRPALWMDERYSEAVVASMAAALREILAQGPCCRVAWFGHSGGGSLAVLLAARVPRRRPWSRPRPISTSTPGRRHAAPGRSSARSIRRASRRSSAAVVQRHYAGGRDEVVPPEVTRKAWARASPPTVILDYDHRCCWEKLWPGLLADLAKQDAVRAGEGAQATSIRADRDGDRDPAGSPPPAFDRQFRPPMRHRRGKALRL